MLTSSLGDRMASRRGRTGTGLEAWVYSIEARHSPARGGQSLQCVDHVFWGPSAARHHHVQSPLFPKTYVPVFISPGHTAQSQIGSKQIYGYLLDVFEIHKSFHHRKPDLTSVFCEALLALAHSPPDVSLPPNSANSSENESTDPVSAHCLDQRGPSQTAKGSFSKRHKTLPSLWPPTWPLGGRYQTDPPPACPCPQSVGSPTQPSKTSRASCGHPDTRGP